MKGIIKDNKVYCFNCEKHDYRIKNYRLETNDNDKCIVFECRCNYCNANFEYNYSCKGMKDKRY